MKKLLIIIVVIGIAGGGFWYWNKTKKAPVENTQNPSTSTYKNVNVGVSFTYPKELTAITSADTVTLHHEVPFVHHDYCDFKGEGDTTIPTLTDFNVKFHVVNKGIVDAMKSESPYIPEENFVNGAVIPSPGFIDSYKAGDLTGYSIFEGAEGCGHVIYYLKVEDKKTLVVTNDMITVFTGAIDVENQSKAEAVPGVLNKQKASALFDSVMKTVKVD